MDTTNTKIKKWLDAGRDPRTAYWQGGIESVFELFKPYLEPGKLMPVKTLEENELSLFLEVMTAVDLSPGLFAAFLPPAIADKMNPPESAEELQRIEKDTPSVKILIVRPGAEQRILCAELSEFAHNPGADIFQEGAFLGSYHFESQQDGVAQLNKIIRVHLWEKRKWSRDETIRYTVNWFEKMLSLPDQTVHVETDFSFFHSPTLLKSNKIDVIFTLIYETITKRLNTEDDPLQKELTAILTNTEGEQQTVKLHDFLDQVVFEFLSFMKAGRLIQFEDFTNKETQQFNQESTRTIRTLLKQVQKRM